MFNWDIFQPCEQPGFLYRGAVGSMISERCRPQALDGRSDGWLSALGLVFWPREPVGKCCSIPSLVHKTMPVMTMPLRSRVACGCSPVYLWGWEGSSADLLHGLKMQVLEMAGFGDFCWKLSRTCTFWDQHMLFIRPIGASAHSSSYLWKNLDFYGQFVCGHSTFGSLFVWAAVIPIDVENQALKIFGDGPTKPPFYGKLQKMVDAAGCICSMLIIFRLQNGIELALPFDTIVPNRTIHGVKPLVSSEQFSFVPIFASELSLLYSTLFVHVPTFRAI